MTKAEIKELMDFFGEKQGINELKIKDKDFEIEIKKYGANAPVAAQAQAAMPAPQMTIVAPSVTHSEKPVSKGSMDTIDSPMVGTFYKAPSPGAAEFVSVGQVVHKGDTIGIIEAMKIMNEIEAEFDCRIKKALVDDGQPVEYAMALFEVEKL